jgi:hypothetical protein
MKRGDSAHAAAVASDKVFGAQCDIFATCIDRLKVKFKHRYVPGKVAQSTIVPLVQCKGGDLTDVSNYRAIMLSHTVTKI